MKTQPADLRRPLSLGKGMSALADFLLCISLYYGGGFDKDLGHPTLAICHPVFMRRFRYWRTLGLSEIARADAEAARCLARKNAPKMIELPPCDS